MADSAVPSRHRPRVLAPYLFLSSFVRQDFNTLRTRYDVVAVDCRSWSGVLRAAALAARVDCVFCWFGSTRFLPVVLAGRGLGRKVVIVAGGYDVAAVPGIGYGNMRSGTSRILGRRVLRAGHAIAAISRSAVADLERNVGISAPVVRLMYLGIQDPVRNAPPPAKQPLVLTVARADMVTIHRKGLLTVAGVSRRMPDVPFVLAGSYEAEAATALQKVGGANFEMRGVVTDAELASLYARASVYLQPSLHEGFGVSVAEAMLYGCVPVVTRLFSLPEVVGGAGLYVQPGDVEGAATEVRRVLAGSVSLAEDPRDRVLRLFPAERRREQLLAMMDEVLS